MTEELDVYGIFIHGAVAAAVLAALLHQVVRYLFGRAGLYGVFWNAGIVDAALFVILWAIVVVVARPAVT